MGGLHETMQEWTPMEDQILMKAIRDMSKRSWVEMQIYFPYRSVSSIRNRYQRLTKKNHSLPPKQKCRYCGKYRRGHICEKELLCEEILEEEESPDSHSVVEVTVQNDITRDPFPHGVDSFVGAVDGAVEDDYILRTPILLTAARLSQISQ